MQQRKKIFRGTAEDFGHMSRVQDTARELARRHLDRPYREMVRAGRTDLEIAGAFVMPAYHLLRSSRSEKDAANTLEALAHFGRKRLEEGRRKRRVSRLH